MIVTYVMVAVCIAGVLGGVASVLSYDDLYGKSGSRMRIPKHSRRNRQTSRPSRQLEAIEAALAEDPPTEQPTARSDVRSHGRWTRR